MPGMYGATKVKGIWFAVYEPPREGLPYLAVMHLPDGTISAAPCPTREEAEAVTSRILSKVGSDA
jgi:hypothetical protein